MSNHVYDNYEEIVNNWKDYGFDSQEEAIEWLAEHLNIELF